MLTAYHIIEGAKRLEVYTTQGPFPAEVLIGDAANDIAILSVKVQGIMSYLPLVSSAAAKSGDAVFTFGFPNIGLQGTEPKYTEGTISSLTGAANDPRHFQISTPVQPGNSGGPLIDEQGRVVGVIIARLSEEAALQTTGSLPENVNYAVKSSYILPLLEAVPDVEHLAAESKENDKPTERSVIIEKAKAAVGLVVCY